MIKQIISLLKVQFQVMVNNSGFVRGKKNHFSLLLPMLLFSYLSVMYTIAYSHESIEPSVSLTLVVMMGLIILMIFTFQASIGSLFDFKDFDLLASLPISQKVMLLSKLFSFYSLQLFYTIFLFVPGAVILGVQNHCGIMYYLLMVVSCFFLPMLPMLISSLLAYIVQWISSKFLRFRSLVHYLLFGIMFVLIFVLILGGQSLVFSRISENALQRLTVLLPFITFFIRGMFEENLLYLLFGILLNLLPFILFVLIFSRNYTKLNARLKIQGYHQKFKLTALNQQSCFMALLKKEIRTYLSCGIYVFNTAFSSVLVLIGGIAYLFFERDLVVQMVENEVPVNIMLAITFMFLSLVTCTTNCTISLEGKQLWIMKTLPVPFKVVMAAKCTLNLLLIIPANVISLILISFSWGLNWLDFIIILGLILTSAFFITFLGLLVNLKIYNLEWSSPVYVVKQSSPVLITVFTGLILGIGCGSLLIAMNLGMYSFGWIILLFAIADAAMYLILNKRGDRWFSEVN